MWDGSEGLRAARETKTWRKTLPGWPGTPWREDAVLMGWTAGCSGRTAAKDMGDSLCNCPACSIVKGLSCGSYGPTWAISTYNI